MLIENASSLLSLCSKTRQPQKHNDAVSRYILEPFPYFEITRLESINRNIAFFGRLLQFALRALDDVRRFVPITDLLITTADPLFLVKVLV